MPQQICSLLMSPRSRRHQSQDQSAGSSKGLRREPGSPSQSSGTTKARKRRAVGFAQLHASLAIDSQRKPCAFGKMNMTKFAFVCNTAEYCEVPKIGKRKYRGWMVRFRVARMHIVPAVRTCSSALMQSFERVLIMFCATSKESFGNKIEERHAAWAKLYCKQHGIGFVSKIQQIAA